MLNISDHKIITRDFYFTTVIALIICLFYFDQIGIALMLEEPPQIRK